MVLSLANVENVEIHEINSIDKFFELQNDWNDVLKKSKDDNAFLTWENTAIAIKNLKSKESLRILYVTSGNKILAIAPLKQSKHMFKGNIGYRAIESLDYGNSTDYTGLILTEHKAECLNIILKYLYQKSNWDYLNFNDLPQDSSLVSILTKNQEVFPKFWIKKGAICPYIVVPDKIETYLNSLDKRFLKNLRRRFRKLQKDYGNISLKEYKDLDALDDAMEVFFNLHQRRWVSKKEPGALSSYKSRNIFSERARLFAQKDWFRLYFLTVNDKPVAAEYTIEYNQKLHHCLSGFDPVFSQYSVGNLLLLKIIERSVEKGIKECDLMKGEESYKFSWTRRYRQNWDITFLNTGFLSRLIHAGVETVKKTKLQKII